MIYYANPATDEARDAMAAGLLGCITTPDQGNRVFQLDGWDVILDNGCFSGRWSRERWLRWLIDQPRDGVRFAVAPDVFDPDGAPCHEATLDRWRTFGPLIERHGFVPAFVCQVGATADNVPDAPVLFLGGTDEFKLGPAAWAIVERHHGDRWVHMGRVNSKRRFDTARAMRCHSCDGTFLTFGPDKNLPQLLAWLADADARPMLWEAS